MLVQAGNVPRTVLAPLHLRSARPTRVGSCGRVDPGVEGHPSSRVAFSCSGAGPRGDRDRLGDVYRAAGTRGVSTGESEVKFAISKSSQPGPSAQFPVALDAGAGSDGACLTRGDRGGGSRRSGRSRGVCTEKRICPGTAHLPLCLAQGPIVRQLAPGGHRFEKRVPGGRRLGTEGTGPGPFRLL